MFILLKNSDGRRLVINTNLAFAVEEDAQGNGVLISINGAHVPTGETFDTVMGDLEKVDIAMGEVPGPA